MAIDLGVQAAFGFANDPIVIRHYGDGIKGGKVLDVTDYTDEFVRAGHVIIKETETGVYKPLPIEDDAYVTLPDGYEYAGILVASVPTAEPFAAIMTDGEVNDEATPVSMDNIMTAFKAAVPTIRFDHD